LASDHAVIPDEHCLVAPTLLRSQVLSQLYTRVRDGVVTKTDAERHLDYVRGLRIRLLGDRVLQSLAWKIADQLGMADTLTAEYLALTRLQADAFITLDGALAEVARSVVTVATIKELTGAGPAAG
jgi:predicted nucleic acid-binding protein